MGVLLPEERRFSIELASGEKFCGVVMLDDSRRGLIYVDGKVYRMLWSERWGPSVADQHGDPANKQPGARHAFWRAASLWNRQGRRMKGAEAIWHEPAPEILRVIGRQIVEVIQVGEDADYSRSVVVRGPAENPAQGVALGRQGNFPPEHSK